MIFTVYTLAKKNDEMIRDKLLLFYSGSIINDQIADIESLGYTRTAVELSEKTLRPVSYVA